MFIIHSLNTATGQKETEDTPQQSFTIQYKYKLRFAQIEIFVILFFSLYFIL